MLHSHLILYEDFKNFYSILPSTLNYCSPVYPTLVNIYHCFHKLLTFLKLPVFYPHHFFSQIRKSCRTLCFLSISSTINLIINIWSRQLVPSRHPRCSSLKLSHCHLYKANNPPTSYIQLDLFLCEHYTMHSFLWQCLHSRFRDIMDESNWVLSHLHTSLTGHLSTSCISSFLTFLTAFTDTASY